MPFFRPKAATPAFEPKPTELDERWFTDWAVGLLEAKGDVVDPQNVSALWDKANLVIHHDARDYVSRYKTPRDLQAYDDYFQPGLLPWNLVSRVTSFGDDSGWEEFIITDAKAKLTRFGQIFVDPSTAN